MSVKTTVTALTAQIKRKIDYDITDSDLDTLILDFINDALKLIKQWLMDAGLHTEVTNTASFKTIEDQAYVDLTQARIAGDKTTFTGAAGDKVDVKVDGTETADVDLSAQTTIAGVVTQINNAVAGSNPASRSTDGYLILTSPTTGASSAIIIEDDAAASGAVADLFSVSAERTQNAINDVDEIISLSIRENDFVLEQLSISRFRELYPDPANNSANNPEHFALLDDYVYFGPTPSVNRLIYADYIFDPAVLTGSSTISFKNKYDPLIKALVALFLAKWFDPSDAIRIQLAEKEAEFFKNDLITLASKNINQNAQSRSRREVEIISPRVPDTGTFA